MDYVIIVAGGKGLRMGSDIPKQFLPIGGKPVLMRTIERFREYSPTLQIILVLPKAQQGYWRQLCQQYGFPLPQRGGHGGDAHRADGGGAYLLADGGETRFHSVQHGLALIPDDAEGIVGVHDGVRPFPSIDVIHNCYETAREKKAVIPVIPVVETMRKITQKDCVPHSDLQVGEPSLLCNATSITVPRNEYRLVQTPQCFDIPLLIAANRQPYNDGFTDDASVVEAFGFDITLVDGNRENIKITTPYDITVAEAIIQHPSSNPQHPSLNTQHPTPNPHHP